MGLNTIFETVPDFFNFVGDVVNCYLPNTFHWIWDHVTCGFDKIQSLPDCFFYYALEIFGKMLYLPIALIVYFTKSQDTENGIWESIESIDKTIYEASGDYKIHISHYSDSINEKCYKCKIRKYKRMPSWPFGGGMSIEDTALMFTPVGAIYKNFF